MRPGNPLEHVQDTIMRKTYKHMAKLGNSSILTGDLNGIWDSTKANHKLKEWGDNNGWHNHLYDAAKTAAFPIHTYWKGVPISWIDHILTYGESGWVNLQGI